MTESYNRFVFSIFFAEGLLVMNFFFNVIVMVLEDFIMILRFHIYSISWCLNSEVL